MSTLPGLVGTSQEIQSVCCLARKVADTDSTILITGASGTGKEMVAQAIHELSGRKPFVAVNCAAISESLIESVLFGHEKGSFTGAFAKQIGKFEQAHGGTIFLDEIGSMKSELQAKMLRALQEKEVERIGGRGPIKIDVRVIAASNENMGKLVKDGTFRSDLFFRLNVIGIRLPSLLERPSDIPVLIDHFIRKYNEKFNRSFQGFTAAAESALMDYDWPGNVRQLENLVERMVVINDHGMVDVDGLPTDIIDMDLGEVHTENLKEAVEMFSRRFILRILEQTRWNQTQAAKRLGIHRNTMMTKITELGLREVWEERYNHETKEGAAA